MPHTMAPTFYYCKWCGKSFEELVENNENECHGTSGIYHINYLKNKKEFDTIMDPILDKLLL